MLRIVAENLAENAIRYAGHGATFTLSGGADDGARRAHRRRRRHRRRADDLPRLFERFWRADARARRAAPASGSRS